MSGVVSPGVEGPGLDDTLGKERGNRVGEVVRLGIIYVCVLLMGF